MLGWEKEGGRGSCVLEFWMFSVVPVPLFRLPYRPSRYLYYDLYSYFRVFYMGGNILWAVYCSAL